jgi:hypothetical protein
MKGSYVYDEFERMWKKADVAWFKVLSWHLPGGTEDNYENCQDNRSPDRDLNPGPPNTKQEC